MKVFLSLLLLVICFGCSQQPPSADQMEVWKEEVRQAEADFAALAASDGIPAAFESFASDDAVLLRGNELIKGKEAIVQFYSTRNNPDAHLEWAPDFIDVAISGDLAYTYGGFTYSAPDSTGQRQTATGTFHSVWKRQADGSWKYVWD